VPGVLPDGYWQFVLAAGAIDGLSSDYKFQFCSLGGDSDYNHVVDFDDYTAFYDGFNKGLSGWEHGDFDFNNVVESDDGNIMPHGCNGPTYEPAVGPDTISVNYVPSDWVVTAQWDASTVTGMQGWRLQRSFDGHDFSGWHTDLLPGANRYDDYE